ncbi:MAG: hypothetical protein LBP64_07800 [Tannerella sp.]|jgi:hypothetical protein|nr:hypothetical protein [Tannerella sp.]
MNKNENDIVKTIFARMAAHEEPLPDHFTDETMKRIRYEDMRMRKRNERLQWLIPFAVLPVIVAPAVALFIYLGIPFPKITFPALSIPAPFLSGGALVLLLLVADLFVRQAYYKKHPF